MSSDRMCEQAMLEISTAHDEKRDLAADVVAHMRECPVCSRFEARIGEIDELLAPGDYHRAPDLTTTVMGRIRRQSHQWWSVAAVALIGIVVGALVGGLGTRLDTGQAQDLGELFHTAGSDLDGLSADLVVVERGLHPSVPERVYVGEIDYVAPERLAIELVDTTDYPDPAWTPNDVSSTIADGDRVTIAGSPCPVDALPDCLVEPSLRVISDQPPFADILPLEIIGPGRSLTWPGSIELLGTTDLGAIPAIQVRSTVAAVELIGAITDHGAWRDLHPTDEVLMWLHEESLVPIRIEVFPADSPERELWQLRHGYGDDPGDDNPIFVVELSDLVTEPGVVAVEVPPDAPTGGFVDGTTALPEPALPDGFSPHRSGSWHRSDGNRVEVASWSDGRSWLMVQMTRDWDEPRLFGLSQPFVAPIDLADDSVAYLSPTGDAIAIHGEGSELLVSGSVPGEALVEAAASLGVRGLAVPPDWQEATNVTIDELPAGTLVPEVDGWSILGRIDQEGTTVLLAGGGARTILVHQSPGSRLDPPIGPDYSEVRVRGLVGRYDASESTLEWIEDGQVVQMRSETVALSELADLASTMESG